MPRQALSALDQWWLDRLEADDPTTLGPPPRRPRTPKPILEKPKPDSYWLDLLEEPDAIQEKPAKPEVARYPVIAVADRVIPRRYPNVRVRGSRRSVWVGTRWVECEGYEYLTLFEQRHALSGTKIISQFDLPSVPRFRYQNETGKHSEYTPDFYLPEQNRVIEVKGLATLGLVSSWFTKDCASMFRRTQLKCEEVMRQGLQFQLDLWHLDRHIPLPTDWYAKGMSRLKHDLEPHLPRKGRRIVAEPLWLTDPACLAWAKVQGWQHEG